MPMSLRVWSSIWMISNTGSSKKDCGAVSTPCRPMEDGRPFGPPANDLCTSPTRDRLQGQLQGPMWPALLDSRTRSHSTWVEQAVTYPSLKEVSPHMQPKAEL